MCQHQRRGQNGDTEVLCVVNAGIQKRRMDYHVGLGKVIKNRLEGVLRVNGEVTIDSENDECSVFQKIFEHLGAIC